MRRPGSRTTSKAAPRTRSSASPTRSPAHRINSDGPRRPGDQPARGRFLRFRFRRAASQRRSPRCAKLPPPSVAHAIRSARRRPHRQRPHPQRRVRFQLGASSAAPLALRDCFLDLRPPADRLSAAGYAEFHPWPAMTPRKDGPQTAASTWSSCPAARIDFSIRLAPRRRSMAKNPTMAIE